MSFLAHEQYAERLIPCVGLRASKTVQPTHRPSSGLKKNGKFDRYILRPHICIPDLFHYTVLTFDLLPTLTFCRHMQPRWSSKSMSCSKEWRPSLVSWLFCLNFALLCLTFLTSNPLSCIWWKECTWIAPPGLHFLCRHGQIARRAWQYPPGRAFKAEGPNLRAAGWERAEGGPIEEDPRIAGDLRGQSLFLQDWTCCVETASLTRVNSTNVQYEGLRIGGIGRQMNSKVKSVKQGVYRK
jgi:hypothetical protein